MHKVLKDILELAEKRAALAQPAPRVETRDFISCIKKAKRDGRIPLIAEVKPASPTSVNRAVTGAEAALIAKEMERGGAAAISVLTEPHFFRGSLENLESVRNAVKLPVLRKDFIVSELQVLETRADLILLIARVLGEQLNDFVELSLSRGIEPLVEVHDEQELRAALATGARAIGINNRNLDTMEVDIATTERLAPKAKHRIVVSESGIGTPEDAVRMIRAGADALLVGNAIMKGDVYSNTRRFVRAQ
ncbi:MAG TPA: indole-3-glycerol-phosphate synthase [Candidatus Methanoperedenaceae archaeon]|nr:indole-3-glycerol-phosphate synthase [Candidatus Methanoperedenaceae archaeon]